MLQKYSWSKFTLVVVMLLVLIGPGAEGRELETDPDIAQAKAMVQSLRDAYNSIASTLAEQSAKHSYSLQHEVVPFLMNFGPEFGGIVEKIMDATVSLEPGRYRELPFEERPSCPSVGDDEDADEDATDDDESVQLDPCVIEREQYYERLGDADGWVIFGTDGKTYTVHWERIVDTAMFEMNVVDTEGVANTNRGTNHRIVATLNDIDRNDFPSGMIVDGTIANEHINVSLSGVVHYGEFLDALLGMAESSWFKGSIRSDVMTIDVEAESTAQRTADGFEDATAVVVEQSGALEIQFPTFSIQSSLDGALTLRATNDIEIDYDEIESLFAELSEADLFDLQDHLPYSVMFNSFFAHSAFADRDEWPTRMEGHIEADFGLDGFDALGDTISLIFDGIIPEITFTIGGSVQSPMSGSVELQVTLDIGHPDGLSGEIVFHAHDAILTGAFVVPFDGWPGVAVHLENQHGIEARLLFPPDGTPVMEIMKGDKILGEIVQGVFINYISYADGTVESLF